MQELGGGRRGQHLTPVPEVRDARAAMKADAVITLLVDRRLARVEPHADAALGTLGPFVRRESPLRLDRCEGGIAGAGERVEERVSLRVHLTTALGGERRAQDLAVISEELSVSVAELLEQAGRALDIREEHRDRPGRHRRP